MDDRTFLRAAEGVLVAEMEDQSQKEEEETTKSSGIFAYLSKLTSQRTLSRDDLEPVLREMKEHLINKNVAAEIASNLCESVASTLVGQKVGAFSSKLFSLL